jgi:hypothetical protein
VHEVVCLFVVVAVAIVMFFFFQKILTGTLQFKYVNTVVTLYIVYSSIQEGRNHRTPL